MNICVFCSSRSSLSKDTFEQAELFSKRLVEKGHGFVYGGGNAGLMGFFADQIIALKGTSIGVMPERTFPQEVAHQGLTELIYTPDMLARKGKMMEISDAFVIFPGGIGTMDEVLEVITWQTIYKGNKPIIFFNWQGFWDPFLQMLDAYSKTDLFYPETMESFRVVNQVDEIFKEIENAR